MKIEINENSSSELKNLNSGLFKLKEAVLNKNLSGLLITEAEIAAILLCCDKELFDNKGEISDGYHTFNELYEHRCLLFLALIAYGGLEAEARLDHYEGWDVICALLLNGEQISYHVPIKYRDLWKDNIRIVKESEKIIWDGHSSNDVIERLKGALK